MTEPNEKKLTPFDFIEAINNTKEQLIVDEETEKLYVPFVVNRGLSFSRDTLLYANEMNKYHTLTKVMQNDFLLNTIKPKKRYTKWLKAPKSEYVDTVMEWYQCSFQKACELITVLPDDKLKNLQDRLEKGGRKKK